MKRRILTLGLVFCGMSVSLHATEQEMQQALALWQQQYAEYQAALSIAKTDEQRAKLPPPSAEDIVPALWKAVRRQTGTREEALPPSARRDRKDGARTRKVDTYEYEEEWAAPAVVWFVNHPEALAKHFEKNPARLSSIAEALLDSILRVHFNNPIVAEVCPKLAESTNAKVYEIVEKIYARNPSAATRGCAALALSIMLESPSIAAAEGGHARARGKRLYFLRQALNLAPDDATFGSVPLTQVAMEQIYRLRNLAIGSIPPQFSVTDQQGKSVTFPIQGKANLIFFWSPSDDLGLSIMSKQSALRKKYPNLELCPIVPHSDADEWRTILQNNGIETCYMDDANGTVGVNYRVNRLPTAVLVSDSSRILFIGYPNMELQTALDSFFETYAPQKSPQSPSPAQQTPPAPQAPSAPINHDAPPALREMPTMDWE